MADVKFDKRALNRLVKDSMTDVAKDGQKRLDTVSRQYRGKPVTVIEGALRRAFSGSSITPDRAQLKQWAEKISQGTRIEFKII